MPLRNTLVCSVAVLALACTPESEGPPGSNENPPRSDARVDPAAHAAAPLPEALSGGEMPNKRTGLVQLDGNSLVDDGGKFNALGATMMWAAWGYKFDRARLEQNLAFLSEHGFHYIRALGVVGD